MEEAIVSRQISFSRFTPWLVLPTELIEGAIDSVPVLVEDGKSVTGVTCETVWVALALIVSLKEVLSETTWGKSLTIFFGVRIVTVPLNLVESLSVFESGPLHFSWFSAVSWHGCPRIDAVKSTSHVEHVTLHLWATRASVLSPVLVSLSVNSKWWHISTAQVSNTVSCTAFSRCVIKRDAVSVIVPVAAQVRTKCVINTDILICRLYKCRLSCKALSD